MPPRSFHRYAPHPLLAASVEAFRVERRAGPLDHAMPFRILPDGSAHLIFRILGPHGDVLAQPPAAGACALQLVGPRSVYKDTDLRRRALTLIATFHPGGVAPFVPLPAAELADHALDPDVLWGPERARLVEQMAEAGTVPAMIGVLEAHLLRRLVAAPPPDAAVQEAVRRLDAACGRLPVRALADGLGLSERQLRNRFARNVGLGPKTYARIARVRHALDLATHAPGPDWAGLAVTAGFYDQSHLIHDFHALLGESPEVFLRRL